MSEYLILFLLFVIVILGVFLSSLYFLRNKEHKDFEKFRLSSQQKESEFYKKESEFNVFYTMISEKVASDKEISKRRRITMTDRKNVLERDSYTCQICGISRSFLDELCPGLGDYLRLEIDHIVSIKQGGTSDISNLQTLCWRCNSKKGHKKTNSDVKRVIDYGIRRLRPNITYKSDERSRSDILKSHTFLSLSDLTNFIISEFSINQELVATVINKAQQSGVSEDQVLPLTIKLFCKLFDEQKI